MTKLMIFCANSKGKWQRLRTGYIDQWRTKLTMREVNISIYLFIYLFIYSFIYLSIYFFTFLFFLLYFILFYFICENPDRGREYRRPYCVQSVLPTSVKIHPY